MANLEKDELIVKLDESNKKNEFFRNQISSQDEKMKSLEQELAESKSKLEKLSSTKLAFDNRFVSVSIPIKPKDENVYISPFKKNHKESVDFARLDKGKNSDVDTEVSKPVSKPIARVQKKFVFVPTCHLCGVVHHISQIVLCWGKNQNLRLDLFLGILMFLNLFLFFTFVVLVWSHLS